MEVGVRPDGGGVETAAALGDGGVELGEAGEAPVGDRLVHQRPEAFDCVSMLPLYAGFLLPPGGTAALIRSSSAALIRTSQMRCPPRAAMRPRRRPSRSHR